MSHMSHARDFPRARTITPDEARAALAALPPDARRLLALVVSQALDLDGMNIGRGVVVAAAELAAAGLPVRRARADGPPVDPDALVDDATPFREEVYLPPGRVEVVAGGRLYALLWALLTGEPQSYTP